MIIFTNFYNICLINLRFQEHELLEYEKAMITELVCR